jgi:hypothetical protein
MRTTGKRLSHTLYESSRRLVSLFLRTHFTTHRYLREITLWSFTYSHSLKEIWSLSFFQRIQLSRTYPLCR